MYDASESSRRVAHQKRAKSLLVIFKPCALLSVRRVCVCGPLSRARVRRGTIYRRLYDERCKTPSGRISTSLFDEFTALVFKRTP